MGKEITMSRLQFLCEIGKAYKRGLTEGVLAEKRGDQEFIDKHIIPEKFWDDVNIRR